MEEGGMDGRGGIMRTESLQGVNSLCLINFKPISRAS